MKPMEDIFDRETEIIVEADNLLEANSFSTAVDRKHYGNLLIAYKRLLKQMRTMVRMSDIMQSKLSSMSGELERLSQIDGLTGLYNRRFINEIYRREWKNAMEHHIPLGVLMIDIDYFKKYNDTFGHLEGDACLQKIAGTIEETVRDAGAYTGRFGGEEFIVLMKGADLHQCTQAADRIIGNVSSLEISCMPSDYHVSVSVGIGRLIPTEDMNPESLINTADQALYCAKSDGRNCFRLK
jgi:diguanylate cyclase (GGDEF)-like protein